MSRRYRFRQVDVFTDRPLAGNPLAVFPDADGLSDAEMQALAREMNLSETTFVLPPTPEGRRGGADYRVRIFQPVGELPFAGHPAIGTAWVLADDGRFALRSPSTVVHQQLAIGVLAISLSVREPDEPDGAPLVTEITMTQGLVELVHRAEPEELDEIAEALEIRAQELRWPAGRSAAGRRARPAWISTGLPYLVVPFSSIDLLADVDNERSLDVARLAAVYGSDSAALIAPGNSGAVPDADIHARILVHPRSGIIEDPATGGAAGPICVFLGLLAGAHDTTHRVVIEQGVEVGRPSRLVAEADFGPDGRPGEVRVSGQTVPVIEGWASLP